MRATWTDSRLDDFKDRIDSRLDDLSDRIGDLSSRVDAQSGRIDALQHWVIQGFIAMMVVMVTGFMGLAGLIVTKL